MSQFADGSSGRLLADALCTRVNDVLDGQLRVGHRDRMRKGVPGGTGVACDGCAALAMDLMIRIGTLQESLEPKPLIESV